MNRDERHDRPPELPPQLICEKHRIHGPLDPKSGGTWIAHNENGFWGCLLNGYFEDETHDYKDKTYKSRGEILINLLRTDNPLEAIETLQATNHPSFRLLIGSPTAHKLFIWDGTTYKEGSFHATHNNNAFFLSSSSWDQDNVIQIRAEMFKDWTSKNEIQSDIPSFHRSQSPTPESAPLMHRSYSATKSIISLDITKKTIESSYLPIQKNTLTSKH